MSFPHFISSGSTSQPRIVHCDQSSCFTNYLVNNALLCTLFHTVIPPMRIHARPDEENEMQDYSNEPHHGCNDLNGLKSLLLMPGVVDERIFLCTGRRCTTACYVSCRHWRAVRVVSRRIVIVISAMLIRRGDVIQNLHPRAVA